MKTPLAYAPALWGKHPSHGDYLAFGSQAGDAQAWRDWLHLNLDQPLQALYQNQQQPSERLQRSQLDRENAATTVAQDLARYIPICFVLPAQPECKTPETMLLQQRTGLYLIGVMRPSHDEIGRQCPLIIYQWVDRKWLLRYGFNTQIPDVSAWRLTPWHDVLARSMAHDHAQGDASQLAALMFATWRTLKSSTHWVARLKRWDLKAHKPTDERDSKAARLLHQYFPQGLPEPQRSIYAHLEGVPHFPWANWIQELLKPIDKTHNSIPAQGFFWQMDGAGRIINASGQLIKLWPQPEPTQVPT